MIHRNLCGVELGGIEDVADFSHVINTHSTHVPVNRDTFSFSSAFLELRQMLDVLDFLTLFFFF